MKRSPTNDGFSHVVSREASATSMASTAPTDFCSFIMAPYCENEEEKCPRRAWPKTSPVQEPRTARSEVDLVILNESSFIVNANSCDCWMCGLPTECPGRKQQMADSKRELDAVTRD